MSSYLPSDEGANVLIIGLLGIFYPIPVPDEGGAHYTVSQVTAELRERGYKIGCIGSWLLTKMSKPFYWHDKSYDHCKSALDHVIEGQTNG